MNDVVRVQLSFYGLQLEPDAFTRLLGVLPTRTLQPETTRERDLDGTIFEEQQPGLWLLDTSESLTSLHAHLQAVVKACARLPEASERIPVTSRQLTIHFAGSFNEQLPERDAVHAAIGPELLAQLERLGLAISWSLVSR